MPQATCMYYFNKRSSVYIDIHIIHEHVCIHGKSCALEKVSIHTYTWKNVYSTPAYETLRKGYSKRRISSRKERKKQYIYYRITCTYM